MSFVFFKDVCWDISVFGETQTAFFDVIVSLLSISLVLVRQSSKQAIREASYLSCSVGIERQTNL
jgi:hypothetical protein